MVVPNAAASNAIVRGLGESVDELVRINQDLRSYAGIGTTGSSAHLRKLSRATGSQIRAGLDKGIYRLK